MLIGPSCWSQCLGAEEWPLSRQWWQDWRVGCHATKLGDLKELVKDGKRLSGLSMFVPFFPLCFACSSKVLLVFVSWFSCWVSWVLAEWLGCIPLNTGCWVHLKSKSDIEWLSSVTTKGSLTPESAGRPSDEDCSAFKSGSLASGLDWGDEDYKVIYSDLLLFLNFLFLPPLYRWVNSRSLTFFGLGRAHLPGSNIWRRCSSNFNESKLPKLLQLGSMAAVHCWKAHLGRKRLGDAWCQKTVADICR